jgi:hypothetical protein
MAVSARPGWGRFIDTQRGEPGHPGTCNERGRQLGRPYSDSAVTLILKIDFPVSSAIAICQSGLSGSRLEMSRAISANIPEASLLAASSSGQSEVFVGLAWPLSLIVKE